MPSDQCLQHISLKTIIKGIMANECGSRCIMLMDKTKFILITCRGELLNAEPLKLFFIILLFISLDLILICMLINVGNCVGFRLFGSPLSHLQRIHIKKVSSSSHDVRSVQFL